MDENEANLKKIERRKDSIFRKKVSEMNAEEMRLALLTSDKAGIGNERAYNESNKKAFQASIDIDSLGWINDNLGHLGGDLIIREVGRVLDFAGVDAYHKHGDEFVAQFDTEEEATRALETVRQLLSKAEISHPREDGTITTTIGIGVSYGIGPTYEIADAKLYEDKARRTSNGERAAKGCEPKGVLRGPSTGNQDSGSIDTRTATGGGSRVGIGDIVRYTERDKSTVEGIISKIQKTEGGRLVFSVTQELVDQGGDLITTRIFEGNAEIEIVSKNTSTLLPDVFLGFYIPDMRTRAVYARNAAIQEAAIPKFIIQKPEQFTDAPQSLIDRMNEAERNNEVAIINMAVSGFSSKYTLYENGFKVCFDGDWGNVAQGPSGDNAVVAALRYRSEDDILAMTSAAKVAIEKMRVSMDMLRAQDREKEALFDATVKQREALRDRLVKVKFKKESFAIKTKQAGVVNIDGETVGGIAVHLSFGSKRSYSVTSIATGSAFFQNLESKSEARLIAARIATAADFSALKDPTDFRKEEFSMARNIALAIRATSIGVKSLDPLVQPELDAAITQKKQASKPADLDLSF